MVITGKCPDCGQECEISFSPAIPYVYMIAGCIESGSDEIVETLDNTPVVCPECGYTLTEKEILSQINSWANEVEYEKDIC